MTAIIDTNFQTLVSLYQQVNRKCSQNPASKCYKRDRTINYQSFQQQNCFQVIVNQVRCPYLLLFTITTAPSIIRAKIHLLKSNRSLLKISSQQLKTYLIKKFQHFNDIYAPRINPFTGAIYFDLDYFWLKASSSAFAESNFNTFYKTLNQEKLFELIYKFYLFYQDREQKNWSDTEFEMRKNFQKLLKTVQAVNDSDLIQIQSMIQHMNKKNKNQYPQNEQKKQQISHLKHYFSAKNFLQKPCNKRLISKQIKEIQFEATNFNSLAKRNKGKSNYEILMVNIATQKKIQQMIQKMAQTKTLRKQLKVVKNYIDKITLNIQRQEEDIYIKKMKFLSRMPKNTEYHFLDKYFQNPGKQNPVIISLSIKEESVHHYLLTNALSVSLETKMRILLQVCTSIHTLLEEKNIILKVNSLKKIHITKNLTIKLRDLANFFQIDSYVMVEEKAGVNLKLLDNWMNLSELYFKLFYGYDIGFVRSAVNIQAELISTEYFKSVTMSKRVVGEKLVPQGFQDATKYMLVGLNYIFQSLINKAGKIVLDLSNKNYIPNQIYNDMKSLTELQHQNEITKRLLGYKLICCWLFKNFEMIYQEGL